MPVAIETHTPCELNSRLEVFWSSQGKDVLEILQESEEVQRAHVAGFVYVVFARRAYAGQ